MTDSGAPSAACFLLYRYAANTCGCNGFFNFIKGERIMKMKKMLMAFLMPLVILTISQPANADTLSDLRAACTICHNVILHPSGWSLSGSPGGRQASHKTLDRWLATISYKESTFGYLPATTSKTVAAQFLYDKQYLPAAITAPLTSIAIWTYGIPIEIGQTLIYSARGTHSDGSVRHLRSGPPWDSRASMSVACLSG